MGLTDGQWLLLDRPTGVAIRTAGFRPHPRDRFPCRPRLSKTLRCDFGIVRVTTPPSIPFHIQTFFRDDPGKAFFEMGPSVARGVPKEGV